MYKEYFILDNLKWLIYHKIQPYPTEPNHLNVCQQMKHVQLLHSDISSHLNMSKQMFNDK